MHHIVLQKSSQGGLNLPHYTEQNHSPKAKPQRAKTVMTDAIKRGSISTITAIKQQDRSQSWKETGSRNPDKPPGVVLLVVLFVTQQKYKATRRAVPEDVLTNTDFNKVVNKI